jgi:hypothetical protein
MRFQVLHSHIRDEKTLRRDEGNLLSWVRFHIQFTASEQAAWLLQIFATTFYSVFSVVVYTYIGSTVQSPALFSLPLVWSKIAFGIALGNFLMQADFIHIPLSLR